MRPRLLIPLLMLLAVALPAAAQDETARFERQLEEIRRQTLLQIDPSIPAGQRTEFDYGGYVNFSFLAVDDPLQETHILRQTELAGYARLNIDGVHDFFLRARGRYQDFNTGDDFNGNGDDLIGPKIDRAYYTFDFGNAVAAYEGRDAAVDFSVTAGRQLVHWVNGLTLSREIDGATGVVEVGRLSLTGVGGVTRKDSFDIDPFRPDFDDDTRRGFFGAMAAYQLTPKHRPFVYGLIQRDYNDSDPQAITIGETELDAEFEYDSHYIGAGSTGHLSDQLLYAVEVVYEGGEGRSSRVGFDSDGAPLLPLLEQTDESIEAWALDARFDYLFHDDNHTRGIFEVVLASGDSDRSLHSSSVIGGNRSGTGDRSFNGFGLVQTGLAFFPSVSNIVLVRGGVATMPFPDSVHFRRFQVGADAIVTHKFDSDAPINEPTNDSSYLGTELDVFANWQIHSDVSVVLRYGVFFPGEAVATDHDERHFLFTGVTYAF